MSPTCLLVTVEDCPHSLVTSNRYVRSVSSVPYIILVSKTNKSVETAGFIHFLFNKLSFHFRSGWHLLPMYQVHHSYRRPLSAPIRRRQQPPRSKRPCRAPKPSGNRTQQGLGCSLSPELPGRPIVSPPGNHEEMNPSV